MKVLLTGASFRPSYGGPAISVPRLGAALADLGVEVGLWAADGSTEAAAIDPHALIVRLEGGLSAALATFGTPNVIHDNGLWLPHNHRLADMAHRLSIPRVVSTRGMAEPWAMRHKRFKKLAAWALYQGRDLRRADLHHVTAEAEAENLRRLRLGVPIRMIPNGVDPAPDDPEPTAAAPGARRKALFLGRIHPVKGLPMLVEAWARIAPAGWMLEIAGPDEAGHLAQVQRKVDDLGLSGAVEFVGPLTGESKTRAFRRASLFVLPTHSENFGMAIAEALGHGLPVLTTEGAPWPMLVKQGCGWWTPINVDGLEQGLREALASDPAVLGAMGQRGRAFVREAFSWEKVGMDFAGLYDQLVA